ncbi:jacalin-like lectin [Amycolatopsis sp. NPDC051371]|uniref:jacalin-like lectin n=1 Tax=Amycolatopsis sp. NPDC051371 TaxID=3155800 RepID=UPI003415DA80
MRSVFTALTTAVLAASALSLTAPAAHAAGGTFSVLSYNVAGLPEGISSAPTPRAPSTTAIGQRLGPYDLVHVQEDFNYHANLYAADAHPYRTPTSGGAGIGSGLNSLSALPVDELERVRWNSCQFDSGDCLTPKGFTFTRLRLAEGVYVDAYNIHTNAGTNDGDQVSRAANLAQLTAFITTHSAGNAVVVMGDTNTRYTRAADTIRAFASDNGLTDAWVRLERGGVPPAAGSDPLVCDETAVTNACEIVDKVLYRGNKLITLDATYYNNEHNAFLDASGAMLSDHDPVTVRFSWSVDPEFRLSDRFGGPHGTPFTDLDRVAPAARASTFTLSAGARLDRIGSTSADGTTFSHGGTGGTPRTYRLADGEYAVSAELCRGSYNGHTRVFSASITTNRGGTLAGGTRTSDCTTATAPDGWQIAGFHGRAGDEVDQLGFIYTRR